MIDLEGMSKSEEYEYTLRRLATFSTGFSNKLLSGIDTAGLEIERIMKLVGIKRNSLKCH